jgi:hypothetical protein
MIGRQNTQVNVEYILCAQTQQPNILEAKIVDEPQGFIERVVNDCDQLPCYFADLA